MTIQLSGGAGSGGSPPKGGPSCILTSSTTFDLAAVFADPSQKAKIAWSSLADDTYNFNPLGALPAGLGLSAAIDGHTPEITVEEAGVWSFEITYQATDTDTAVCGWVGVYPVGLTDGVFGPGVAPISDTNPQSYRYPVVLQLPDGAVIWAAIYVGTPPAVAAHLHSFQMAVTRLA